MNFLFNAASGLLIAASELLTKVGTGTSNLCVFVFYEPEVPKSLREE